MNSEITSALIAAGGSVLGIILGAVLMWLINRRKNETSANKDEADAAATITTSARSLIDPLNDEIAKLNLKLETMQTERKQEAEAREIEAKTHVTEMEKVQLDLASLKSELFRKEGQIQELRGGVDVLIGQLKQLNIKPKYDPGY